jgi:hypothetical protein
LHVSRMYRIIRSNFGNCAGNPSSMTPYLLSPI